MPLRLRRRFGSSLPGAFSSAEGDDRHAERVRAAQIDAMMRFTPMACVINALNASLVSVVVGPQADPWALGLWFAALMAVCLLGLRAWLARRAKGPRSRASPRAISRASLNAGVLAALWGLVPVLWFPTATSTDQLVIGTVTAGMLCAGGFVLATVSRAACTYVVVINAGSVIGIALSGIPHALVLAALLTLYTATVIRSVRTTAQLFERQVLSEIELRERGEVIQLLLSEFEENASDWLFELDVDGRLRTASSRLSVVSGRPAAELQGLVVADLLSRPSASALASALSAGRPFRDLEVETATSSSPRWWKLSARPILDEAGKRTGWRGVGSDVTETKRARDHIAYLASTDTLTGLPNRPRFLEQATEAIARAQRHGADLAVGCLDLDEFKQVNDTLGHPVGDLLLKRVADDLKSWAGEDVLIGRFGGDEFGLLFPQGMPTARVMARARALIDDLSRSYRLDGADAKVSASIGIAVTTDGDETIHELLRRADFALYRAKNDGRSLATLYDPAMQRDFEEARQLQDDLALAIERDELFLEYQPIVEIATRKVVGFEALLRWRHPERGLVSPMVFIPVAERSGAIVAIGEWVLKEACREAAGWPDGLAVSVNVSPVQIGKSDVARAVEDALRLSGLPASRLEIEITETVFIAHEQDTLDLIARLRALGASVALDDFGTGYSSLGYLGRFPIDKLKIDRSFVAEAGAVPQRTAIVQAILGMARSLGIRTTAEGVENDRVLAWLHLSGCVFAQGYRFAKPMPAAAVPGYLESWTRPAAGTPTYRAAEDAA